MGIAAGRRGKRGPFGFMTKDIQRQGYCRFSLEMGPSVTLGCCRIPSTTAFGGHSSDRR